MRKTHILQSVITLVSIANLKNMSSIITIFIDESGTLPDPQNKTIVVAAIGYHLPEKFIEINRKVRQKLRALKHKTEMIEIKFYQAGNYTKQIYLRECAKLPIDIFALIVDKKGQKIPDTPENFAALSCILLRDCFLFYKNQIKKIIFDKHFHQVTDLEKFDYILKTFLGSQLDIKHVDSSVDIRVNSADMIAGSLLWKYTNRDIQFYELIKDRIVSERILNWKEAKKSFLEKIKNLTRTGASTHPE